MASQGCDGEVSRHTVKIDTPKPNGSDSAPSPPLGSTGHRSRLGRTLLIAGVFALLAMIYVPTPSQRFIHPGYRFIFSSNDTSIAFFQLLLNVGFAALLGAILATILARISKRAVYVTAGCIAVVALSAGVFAFTAAAVARAQSDEKNATELLVLYPRDSQTWLTKFRDAVINWRLALRFGEATRVENRIKAVQERAAQDWRSDPVVDLSTLPDQPTQARTQAPGASGQRAPAWAAAPVLETHGRALNIFDQIERLDAEYNER